MVGCRGESESAVLQRGFYCLGDNTHTAPPTYLVYVFVKLWGRDPIRGSWSAKTTESSIQYK